MVVPKIIHQSGFISHSFPSLPSKVDSGWGLRSTFPKSIMNSSSTASKSKIIGGIKRSTYTTNLTTVVVPKIIHQSRLIFKSSPSLPTKADSRWGLRSIVPNSMDSSSSSSSSPADDIWDYDVFLSFRGTDTRKTFISHLHDELTRCGIRTFIDDEELPSGEDIDPKLRQAIQRSRSSIIVFSRNYASSTWCLEELVEILDCKRNKGQIVIPIYYDVEPSVLRFLTGKYAEAFQKHTSRVSEQKVDKWRAALGEVADLKGHVLANEENGNEARFIHKIVGKVQVEVIARSCIVPDSVVEVSVDSNRSCINRLLSFGSNDVRIIGIYGMGGIGKSAISKAVYNEHVNKFEGSAVIENIKEVSAAADGLLRLQERLLRQLEKKIDKLDTTDEGIDRIKRICQSRRVLILLDDFDNVNQINTLIGQKSWFSSGSRVIVITRDVKLLKEAQVQHTYEMKVLNEEESLKLFMRNAIKEGEAPSKDEESLMIDIARYCGGLPLALEVIGRYLRGENLAYWRNALNEFQSKPHKRVHDRLKISYDALSKDHKAVFLDAACFFIGWEMEHLIKFWVGCGFPGNSVRDLIDKCLFKIDENNCLWMHDHLRDMGREIVIEASEGSLAKQSRLWIPEEVDDLLRNQIKEKVAAEGIITRTMTLDAKAFEVMHKLRFLQIIHNNGDVKVGGSFENAFRELRWLTWNNCPLDILPADFYPRKLIGLEMNNSRIIKLWEEVKHLKHLKFLDLSDSRILETPEFTGTPSLERLILSNCSHLRRIHPSICKLTSLVELRLYWCSSLKELPEHLGDMGSLQTLNLERCEELETLPTSICNLKALQTLNLNFTSIRELPDSFGQLDKLVHLQLLGCYDLETLPASICNLKALQTLNLNGLFDLKELPHEMGNLENLITLDASYSGLEGFPESIRHLTSLVELKLKYCFYLETLPGTICELSSLQILNICGCNRLQKLPDLGNMVSLRELEALDINSLQLLDSISNLKNLESLSFSRRPQTYPQSSYLNRVVPFQSSLKKLTLGYCALRDEGIPIVIGVNSLLSLTSLDLQGNHLCNPSSYLCRLTNLNNLDLSDCKTLVSLHELPPNITKLNLSGCCSLALLPQFPPNLTQLNVSGCISLVSFAELPPNLLKFNASGCINLVSVSELPLNLVELNVSGCTSLTSLSQFPPNLKKLNVSGCISIVSFAELPPNLLEFNASGCINLVSLSELPLNLVELNVSGCSSLASLSQLSPNLTKLNSSCSSLVSLSQFSLNLKEINARGCTSMEVIPNLSNLPLLHKLDLTDCYSLVELQDLEKHSIWSRLLLAGCSKLTMNSILNERFFQRYLYSGNNYGCITFPKWEFPDWIMYQSMESTISFLLPQSLPDNFKGIILWVNIDSVPNAHVSICAAIRNNTSCKDWNYSENFFTGRMPYSWVSVTGPKGHKAEDIGESNLYFRSGDSITISIQPNSGVKVESCGVYWLIGTEGSEAAVDYINSKENDHNLESDKLIY